MGVLKSLATYFVEFKAPRGQLQNDLRAAERDVSASSARMNTTTQAATQGGLGISAIASGIRSTTAPVRGLVTAIGSALGIATRLVGIVGIISAFIGGISSFVSLIRGNAERTAESIKESALSANQMIGALQRRAEASEIDLLPRSSEERLRRTIETLRESHADEIAAEVEKIKKEEDYLDLVRAVEKARKSGSGRDVEDAELNLRFYVEQRTAAIDRFYASESTKANNDFKKANQERIDEWDRVLKEGDEQIRDSGTRFTDLWSDPEGLRKLKEAADYFNEKMRSAKEEAEQIALITRASAESARSGVLGSIADSYSLQRIGQSLASIQRQLDTVSLIAGSRR